MTGEPKDDRRTLLIHLVLLTCLMVGLSAALWYWHEPIWALFSDRERLQTWVAGFGPWGPVISIALNAAQVLAAPMPGQIVGLSNGYLYGLWMGTLYSMIGLALGRALAMGLGRWFGRRLVERLIDADRLARWDRLIHRRGEFFFFLVFLLPFLPDDAVCFLVGLTALSLPRMIVLSILGGLPGVFVSCWIGARASAWPWWAWIPLIGVTLSLAWGFWRYERRLEDAMLALIHRSLTAFHGSGSKP